MLMRFGLGRPEGRQQQQQQQQQRWPLLRGRSPHRPGPRSRQPMRGIIKCFGDRRLLRRPQRLALALATTAMLVLLLATLALRLSGGSAEEALSLPWHYYCDKGFCKKAEITENTTSPLSLGVCQMFCGEVGGLWPKPTGHISFGNYVARLNPDKIILRGVESRSPVGILLHENIERLKHNAKALGRNTRGGGYGLVIAIAGDFDVKKSKLTLDTPEAYTLKIHQIESGELMAEISGKSYFGIRHGLETLSQLIVYDDLHEELKIARDVYIQDEPAFPYRGILLDTSRNFMHKASILRTLDAMAMSKMNTFHWHITDSHSFPYVSRTWPKFSKYGAYSSDKVYTQEDIKEIIKYGLVRGIRVLPEFDAPAHVGEGWQWVGHNATLCFRAQPWKNYCVEPPCGQLNPTSDKVYEVLEGIYADMLQDFEPDFFHMGGDEVNIGCWNSSEIIKDWIVAKGWNLSESSFYQLWHIFQEKAYDKLVKANNGNEIPAILWTSGLTNEKNLKYLDPKKYIVQIWTTGSDPTIGRLIKNNFRVILSNYDALYLDCGFAGWVQAGNNWCSPYIGWQKVYDNSAMKILSDQGFTPKYKHLVLGSEAALWSEQADTSSVDSRLWPRAAALAERLWSDPPTSWEYAEKRMLMHRERLVKRGVLADSLEPEWCLQNEGHCCLNC